MKVKFARRRRKDVSGGGRRLIRQARPLIGGVDGKQRVLEGDNDTRPLLQLTMRLRVVLHEFGERRKLISSVEVVIVPGVLNLYMSDLITTSVWAGLSYDGRRGYSDTLRAIA